MYFLLRIGAVHDNACQVQRSRALDYAFEQLHKNLMIDGGKVLAHIAFQDEREAAAWACAASNAACVPRLERQAKESRVKWRSKIGSTICVRA